MQVYQPFLASELSLDEVRKADADLMSKINLVNSSLDSRLITLNNQVDNLNVPTIVTDPTYGRYRSYPDGSTQGRLISSVSQALETGTVSNDFTYTAIQLVVPPGKWSVMSVMGVFATTNPDHMGTSFWDVDANAEFSEGAVACETATVVNSLVSITNQMVIDRSNTVTIRVRVKRNGASVPNAGSPAFVTLKTVNKLIAVSIL